MVSSPIRVLCVDHIEPVRLAMVRVLQQGREFELVGLAESCHELVETVRRTRPDVILLEMMSPGCTPEETVMSLRKSEVEGGAAWDGRLVVLTASCEPDAIMGAIESGVDGVAMKTDSPGEILGVIRRVANGEVAVSEEAWELCK